MVKSRELFQLIKVMSQSEKRHFKLYATQQGHETKKEYVKLFEAFDKRKNYTEEQFLTDLKGKSLDTHYQITKLYLKKMILKTLRVFHQENSPTSVLRSLLDEIEITYNKSQNIICHDLIKKAKKMAYRYELYQYIIEILTYEKFIDADNKKLPKLAVEEGEIIEKLKNINEYRKVNYTINVFLTNIGSLRGKPQLQKAKHLMNHYLLQNYHSATSFQSQLFFLQTHAIFNHISRNNKASQYWEKIIDLLESRPEMLLLLHRTYEAVLKNFIAASIGNRNINKANIALDKLSNLVEKKHVKNKLGVQFSILSLKIRSHIIIGDFTKGLALINQNKNLLNLLNQTKLNSNMIALHLNICIIYIGNGEYKNALTWSEYILNNKNIGNTRQDLQTLARIMNLIIHFELNNYFLLPYLIRNTYHYLKRKGHLYDFENLFLTSLNKILRMKPEDDINEFFKFFLKKINNIKTPLEKQFIKESEIITWLKSKIENRSFAEIIKEKSSARKKS